MAVIQLTRGRMALVDDEDYQSLAAFKWCYMSNGYAARSVKTDGRKRLIYMHRAIANPPDDLIVDHRNRDTLDNRRRNLRICDHRQNAAAGIFDPGRGSRYRGVFWDKQRRRWFAQIKHRPRQLALGRYADEIAAALAYDLKAIELFGEFARPNFLQVRHTDETPSRYEDVLS